MAYETPTVELLGDYEMDRVQGEGPLVWAIPVAVVAAVAAAVVAAAAIHTVAAAYTWVKVTGAVRVRTRTRTR